MNKSTVLKKVIAIMLACMLLMSAAQAESWRAIVTGGSMKVYADESRIWQIATLPLATVVNVERSENGVALISWNGSKGYASSAALASIDGFAARVTFNTASRVYQKPDLSSVWISVPAGIELNLLATNGQWAMVENGGVVAYTNKAHLTEKKVESVPEAKPDTIVTETFTAVITADSMRVYQAASESSKCIGALPKGLNVTVHANNSAWAYIEMAGNFGFARLSDLNRVQASAPESSVPEKNDPYSEASGESVECMYLNIHVHTPYRSLNESYHCALLLQHLHSEQILLTVQSRLPAVPLSMFDCRQSCPVLFQKKHPYLLLFYHKQS